MVILHRHVKLREEISDANCPVIHRHPSYRPQQHPDFAGFLFPEETTQWKDTVDVHAQSIWVNYNDLTTSLESLINKRNDPQMALIQVSEML